VSGTIRDPAGQVPLYNVNVYVPNAALDAIPEGASCDRCTAQLSGKPIATALTDATGKFVLENVPVVANLPIVIQVGKWRREITIPSVTACVDNPITNADLTRLPRSKAEGHIPKMALTTGGSDALECLIRKIGIADSEFTTDTGNGRVHLYIGGMPGADSSLGTDRFATTLNGGAAFPQATTLWGSANKMLGYDIMLLSCEGSQYADVKINDASASGLCRRTIWVARARSTSSSGSTNASLNDQSFVLKPASASARRSASSFLSYRSSPTSMPTASDARATFTSSAIVDSCPTGTEVAPAFSVPKYAIAHSGAFLANSITRWFAATPRTARNTPTRVASSCRSA